MSNLLDLKYNFQKLLQFKFYRLLECNRLLLECIYFNKYTCILPRKVKSESSFLVPSDLLDLAELLIVKNSNILATGSIFLEKLIMKN